MFMSFNSIAIPMDTVAMTTSAIHQLMCGVQNDIAITDNVKNASFSMYEGEILILKCLTAAATCAVAIRH